MVFCSFCFYFLTPGVSKVGFHVNFFLLLILVLFNHFFPGLYVLNFDTVWAELYGAITFIIYRENRTITWTQSMRRLYFLISRSYKLREPVLLVGDTGGGKTTICQTLSNVLKQRLHILNCHQYTETSDFLGVGLSSSSFNFHTPLLHCYFF